MLRLFLLLLISNVDVKVGTWNHTNSSKNTCNEFGMHAIVQLYILVAGSRYETLYVSFFVFLVLEFLRLKQHLVFLARIFFRSSFLPSVLSFTAVWVVVFFKMVFVNLSSIDLFHTFKKKRYT